MNEKDLLTQAISLSEALRNCPTEQLKPFSTQIERLSTLYDRLSSSIRVDAGHGELEAANTVPRPIPQLAPRRTPSSPEVTPADHQALLRGPDSSHNDSSSRRRGSLHGLLDASICSVPQIYNGVWRFTAPEVPNSRVAVRASHVQNILSLQGRKLRIADGAPEKILVLCASLSLAKDFYHFERQGGWQPKQHLLIERIQRGEDPAVQAVGKHVKHYIAAQKLSTTSSQQKVDATLRLGMKLAIADEIGRENGVHSLSLLLGFAYEKFGRLSYSNLALLRHEVLDSAYSSSIAAFAAVMDQWWPRCQRDYHIRFGDADPTGPLQDCPDPSWSIEKGMEAEQPGLDCMDQEWLRSLSAPVYNEPTDSSASFWPSPKNLVSSGDTANIRFDNLVDPDELDTNALDQDLMSLCTDLLGEDGSGSALALGQHSQLLNQ